jgi:exodeoxyribonuclease VII small subunit
MAAKNGGKPASDGSGDLSYEAAREELLDVVRQLEAGNLPLERSLALWERGEQLAVACQAWLDGARERLAARRPTDAGTDATDATDATGATGATGGGTDETETSDDAAS